MYLLIVIGLVFGSAQAAIDIHDTIESCHQTGIEVLQLAELAPGVSHTHYVCLEGPVLGTPA